jgi:hypothetical protein
MYCEQQIRSLHTIPPQHRICQTDATGGLVHIPQKFRKFNQILNYFMIVKNIAKIKAPALPVCEKVSSSHNTVAIEEMFDKFIFDYKCVYPNEKLIFRLFISDFSWAIMHAALRAFNGEDMESYSTRVFELAQEKSSIDHPTKLWLSSCTSHTMGRFTRSLKKKVTFVDKEQREFAICCFTLLIDCLELASATSIFKLMVYAFG